MSVYIALLRGINVGGHKLIKMADLKRMCEAIGLHRVQTYIQSGNVLFESDEEAGPLRRSIEQEITAVFGFEVPVVLRTAPELSRLIENCPFRADELGEGASLYVALLAEPPAQAGIDRLLAFSSGTDQFRMGRREVYLLYRQPVHKSKLTNNLIEQRLGVPATSRNWQTLSTLADLAAAMGG